MTKKIGLLIFLIAIFSGCVFSRPENETQGQWWENAVFYEIFVRSFYDSDCDGIGDFNGITQKLDYLQDLGVNALWLMPIHPSPSYHGYDVVDYYDVNRDYGTPEDFQNLVEESHKRGIHVIIDLVLNHTSVEHPWFVDAEANPDSPYRDWYIWSDHYPGYTGPFGVAWHATSTGYYYGVFWSGMPDLNFTNPEVTTEMEQVARFWLTEIGVDGFRVDAAKHLIEEKIKQENTDSTHQWFRQFFSFYKSENPQAYTVGEVSGAGAILAKTYTGDQFDEVFNFDLANGFIKSANNGKKQAANSAISLTLKGIENGQYASFLTNHDQNRVMTVLGADTQKAKVAASLLLTTPGTPYIYYGEEIGMQGKKPDEDIRLPMQWSGETNAGFSCPQASVWRPPHENYLQVNVAAQMDEEDSLLSHYQQLIALRNDHPALRTGITTLVNTDTPALFSSLRTTSDERVLVLINLGNQVILNPTISLDASPLVEENYKLVSLLGDLDGDLIVNPKGGFQLNINYPIQPYETILLKLK